MKYPKNFDTSQKLNWDQREQRKAFGAKPIPTLTAAAVSPEANIRDLINAPPPRMTTSSGGLPPLRGGLGTVTIHSNLPRGSEYGGPPPFIVQGTTSVPNPLFGKYHGMEWNGESWVNLPPNADLEREAMEIQLEEMRQNARNSRGNPDLRSWLQSRMERK